MNALAELLAENFGRWAAGGCGVHFHDHPVPLPPPFVPFAGHRHALPEDDGSRPTFFSRLANRISDTIHPPRSPSLALPPPTQERPQPEPNWRGEEEYGELQILLPADLRVHANGFQSFLASVSSCRHHLSLEFIGSAGKVVFQVAAQMTDLPVVRRQLTSHFPMASLLPLKENLATTWREKGHGEFLIIELGLARPFMLPLSDGRVDPFVGLMAALSELGEDEAAVYQVLFCPIFDPWADGALEALLDQEGKLHPLFVPEFEKAAKAKVSQPLFAAVLRIAAKGPEFGRAVELVSSMASPLRQFSSRGGNELFPLSNAGYQGQDHERDLLLRQSRRPGMILSRDELLDFAHLPSDEVQAPAFVRLTGTTRLAHFTPTQGACLGINEHAGEAQEVRLSTEQRLRHLHLVGATGTGKTTLLFNLIRQDIENGNGLALMDPHGDLVDNVMGVIPPERIQDVVLLDPSDDQFVVPFNILAAHSEFEKELLASDLVSIFARWSTSWGDQMHSVFRQAVLAFLESAEGGSLSDLRRFLIDVEWRKKFLLTVSDPDVRFYWARTFHQLGSNKSIGPILTRLETLLAPKPLRLMFSQRENRLDFAGMMDSGKIFLAKLPQGMVGRENAFLLGSLLVAKFQQMAMSRQRMDAGKRCPFFCYLDEFQNFISPSMAEILSGARKYGLGLVLAHQELRQLERDRDVESAVLSNAFTRVAFRVSDADARMLASGFTHFEPPDLQKLKIGEAICRIERADNDFNLRVPLPHAMDEREARERRAAIIAASREKYTRPRKDIEAELLRRFEEDELSHSAQNETAKNRKEIANKPDNKIGARVANSSAKEQEAAHTKVSGDADDAPQQTEPAIPTDAAAPAPVPTGLGKGGYQHRIVQDRIKAAAEKQGFRVTLEMPIGSGRESVDVGLTRHDLRIACEVSVTTTIDHEVGNVRKCLRGGFDVVAVITVEPRRLRQIEAAVVGCLSPEDASRIQYFSPDQFVEYLENLPPPQLEPPSSPAPTQTVRKGWTVKRTFKPLTPEERAAKEAAAIRLLAEEMRPPPKPPTN